VQQHTYAVLKIIKMSFVANFMHFPAVKKFKHRLTLSKVITQKVTCFMAYGVHSNNSFVEVSTNLQQFQSEIKLVESSATTTR